MNRPQHDHQQARRRAEAELSLMRHTLVALGAGGLCWGINLVTSPGYHWFWWVWLGLAIGLVVHGWKAFGPRAGRGGQKGS